MLEVEMDYRSIYFMNRRLKMSFLKNLCTFYRYRQAMREKRVWGSSHLFLLYIFQTSLQQAGLLLVIVTDVPWRTAMYLRFRGQLSHGCFGDLVGVVSSSRGGIGGASLLLITTTTAPVSCQLYF